ncbi:hypothetical protein J3459_011192 [Metarhizium acridum]|nr:hypothetical protein J3459_011192 [Metarhizium acridum]
MFLVASCCPHYFPPMASCANEPLKFGGNFAVLNLDWMSVLFDAIKDDRKCQALMESCAKWNDAVHQKSPRPLTIFTTLSFNPGQPEVKPGSPFARLIAPYCEFAHGSAEVAIAQHFKVDEHDLILQKTRWSATMGSTLEQVLRSQNIDTVVISGLTLSGAVMATIYQLFDSDYNVVVIRDNVAELPIEQTTAFSDVMLHMLLPKMGLTVMSVDEAICALQNS